MKRKPHKAEIWKYIQSMDVLWNKVLCKLEEVCMHNISLNPTNPAVSWLNLISEKGLLSILGILSKEIDDPARPRLGCVAAIGLYNKKGGAYPLGLHLASHGLGELNLVESPVWMKNAGEKLWRLSSRRSQGHDEVASSQSADDRNHNLSLRTYGGALYFKGTEFDLYSSVSGGPQVVDEAMAYVIGRVISLKFDTGNYVAPLELFDRAHEIYRRNS